MCAKLRVIREDEPDEPIDVYQQQVKKGTLSTIPYDRLMIYYRKQKRYSEELEVISKGIEALQNFYADQQKQALRSRMNPKLEALSRKIGKSTGLLDKKGKEVYLPEPLPKWIKRKSVVEDKINKAKNNTDKTHPKKSVKKKKKT